MKLLPHLVSVLIPNHLRGQSLIPLSNHAPPHTTLLCVKQNPGLKPMQMAIIWWLTAFVFIMLRGNWVFLSFTDDWMNYSVVFLSLSSSSLFSSSSSSSLPSSFGPKLATHVQKSSGEERHADHKWREFGDTQTTLRPVTWLCRWIRVIF